MSTIAALVKAKPLNIEPAITEPELKPQLVDILQGYALPKSWANALGRPMLEDDEKKAEQNLVRLSLTLKHGWWFAGVTATSGQLSRPRYRPIDVQSYKRNSCPKRSR